MGPVASRWGSSPSSLSASGSASSSAPDSMACAGVGEVGGVVPGVEEGVLAEPDVDEGRLHAGQDVGHHALVHAAHDRPVTVPLEIQLGEEVTLLDRDAGFE